MRYSFDSRVRFSEVGVDRALTLPAILNYFQDCSTFQSESIGQGIDAVRGRHRVWVVSAWQIAISRYPKLGEEIVVTTFPYSFSGVMGLRNFLMETKDGERIAWANSYWTNLDTDRMMPAKLTAADLEGYDTEEKLDMDYAPRKIRLPEEGWNPEEAFAVQMHHLDANMHVNNGQYICMAENYLPKEAMVSQIRVEYKAQARLHDKICPWICREEDRLFVRLCDEKGNPYAVIEYRISGSKGQKLPGMSIKAE
ncbi:MAG: acyl-[acyl-carrier-protein] thioesterase [Blautia sp.]|nr:acyl-[acyl-carrier-protein] thioesterase [Blautia sp.]